MSWEELFVIGFFAVLAIAGVALAWQGSGAETGTPLIGVHVEADVALDANVPQEPVRELVEAAKRAVEQTQADAHALLVDLREKVAQAEDAFSGLQQAVELLQAEAEAVKGSNEAVQKMAYAVIGASVVAALALLFVAWQASLTRRLVQLMAITAEEWKELDLEQQERLLSLFPWLHRRSRRKNGNGECDRQDDEP